MKQLKIFLYWPQLWAWFSAGQGWRFFASSGRKRLRPSVSLCGCVFGICLSAPAGSTKRLGRGFVDGAG